MAELFRLLYVFAIGATFGWFLELAYRSIKAKRIFNPGFLTGPALPIYGFGNVILYYVTKIDLSFFGARWLQVVAMFVIIAFFMTLLELITGFLFYKFMRLRLWDYTTRFGNYKGFICPLFTAIWGGIGIAYYLFVQPLITDFLAVINGSTLWIVLITVYYTLLAVDIYCSFKLGIGIKNFFTKVHNAVVVNLQEIKERFYKNERRFVFFSILFKINADIKRRLKEISIIKKDKFDDFVSDGELDSEESDS